jgi:hypothetical protein
MRLRLTLKRGTVSVQSSTNLPGGRRGENERLEVEGALFQRKFPVALKGA